MRPWAPIAARDQGQHADRSQVVERSRMSAEAATHWHAEILLDVIDQPAREEFDESVDTRFRIEIYSEEWGYLFCHSGRASWIRVTDIPFVHGRDDFKLLGATPTLKDLGLLVRAVESQHSIRLRRRNAHVVTDLSGAEPAIRRWVEAL